MPTSTTARRITKKTSRTAEWTCMSRAASSLERDPHYRSDDSIAAQLAPHGIVALLRTQIGKAIFRRCLAQKGLYEYVIARTKYIDAAFRAALDDDFAQIVLFGAGFDTRALRFEAHLGNTRVFELDASITQTAKINRMRRLRLTAPPGLTFVPIDFEQESMVDKLHQAGFRNETRSLFILEGVLMYLSPASAHATFRSLEDLAARHSRVVFDYVRAAVVRGDGTAYGEEGLHRSVEKINEAWRFGLEPGEVKSFLALYGFELDDHRDAAALERMYFENEHGALVGHINNSHCIVTAERT